jgi:uncharacterized membrane protein YbhN (UPF0104 family)
MIANTNIKQKLNWVLSIVIVIWLGMLIYKQVNTKTEIQFKQQLDITLWTAERKYYLLIAILLLLINWGVEAIKWQKLLAPLEHIHFLRSLRSVFTGISVSLLTPNRIGEYAGRIIYLKNRNRVAGIAANIVGSVAQFISAATLGIIGLIIYSIQVKTFWFAWYLVAGSALGLAALFYIYVDINRALLWAEQFSFLKKFIKRISLIRRYEKQALIQLIALSFLRYFIFSTQNYLLLLALDVHTPLLPTYAAIFSVFWCMAVLPSVAIAEVPMRTQLSYLFLGVLVDKPISIMTASFALWVINLIIPALVGLLLLLGAKILNDE